MNSVEPRKTADMDKYAAFRKLYDEYRDRIYRMCCYYVSSQEDREDLYQEVFQNLWKGLGGFRGDSTLSTWAYRVTVNTALSFLAKAKARKETPEKYAELALSRRNLHMGGEWSADSATFAANRPGWAYDISIHDLMVENDVAGSSVWKRPCRSGARPASSSWSCRRSRVPREATARIRAARELERRRSVTRRGR
jgi:RNA polymerase sigma factor (sigma-70 family)